MAEFWNIRDIDFTMKWEQTIAFRLLYRVYRPYKQAVEFPHYFDY